MKCFLEATDKRGCSGPVGPSAAKDATHGYCAAHRAASLERANWNDDLSTSRRATRDTQRMAAGKLRLFGGSNLNKRRAA